MATATVRAPQPGIEKGRPARRPLSNYISSNANEDNTTALRLQRLKLLGIIGRRADVLAGMVWEAHHG